MLTVFEEPDTETLRVLVLRVFDGDGFLTRLRNPWRPDHDLAVRFGFTDAPEIDQPGGREAKTFLNSLIGDRWVELAILVKMDTGKVTDRHNRMVCVPYLRQPGGRSRNIELEMVLNGWSWVLDRYRPDDRYFDALEDARRHRRGIWAFDDNVHPWDFKQRKYQRRSIGARQHDARSSAAPVMNCPNGCGGNLVERNGRFGAFWGCSNYPRCRFSRSA